MTTETINTSSYFNGLIRTMVRSVYDLQAIRIQMGNRITANFKAKLGLQPNGMSEKELDAQAKKVLSQLRASYKRITDGIVIENQSEEPTGTLPSKKKFKGDELITSYTELLLMHQYMTIVKDEAAQFYRLNSVLKEIPIYTEFLSHVRGVGPAMAGVIISEIDIHKAEYPSSLCKYSGLDVVKVGTYVDDNGVKHTEPLHKLDLVAKFDTGLSDTVQYLVAGKYPVEVTEVGRSRKDFCLVDRQYINKNGEEATRRSITYNPWLKTKLVGVLGTSFLRAGVSTVDGKKMGNTRRLELAIKEGFIVPENEEKNPDEEDVALEDQVIEFLKKNGHVVVIEPSPYGKAYYDYKSRIEKMPEHKNKTDFHRHNMAIRYAVKRFLIDLYKAWRGLEGLPIAPEYSEAKLGLIHGKAEGKEFVM